MRAPSAFLSFLTTAASFGASAEPLASASCAAGAGETEVCPRAEGGQLESDEKTLLQLELGTKRRVVNPLQSFTGPYRQSLANFEDLQYTGDITLGNQVLQAVLDTGSFEILVFARDCFTCGRAAVGGYSHLSSDTFETGRLIKTHVYGSGSARSVDGVDVCRVGPWTVQHQDFWEARTANMPVLASATFQAIVGLGPPGEPQMMAKRLMGNARTALTRPGSTGWTRERAKEDMQIAELVMAKNDSLLYNLHIRYISACFEWALSAPGYLVWNDTPPTSQPVPFVNMDVISQIHWSAKMSWSRFDGPEGTIELGCDGGCEAVLDTGTSLIAVPSSVYAKASEKLSQLDADCSNMAQMPNLVFGLGSNIYSLPPQSYIGVILGNRPSETQGWLPASQPKVRACELLLMDSGMGGSSLGPMWILGMPFFRYYYTTFDLGKDPYDQSGRKMWTAPAAAGCVPADQQSHHVKLSHARQQPLWRINGSSIRVPRMLRHQRTGSQTTLADKMPEAEEEPELVKIRRRRDHLSE